MSKKRVLFVFLFVIAVVFYFSWLPDPSFKNETYLPRWLLKWSDHYYNLRTAIPFLAVGFLLEAYTQEKHTNEIKYRKCMMDNQINTKNIIIKFVIIPIGKNHIEYVKGMRATGCFGFDDDTDDYLTRGNNVCKDYTLVKYVKEINEMGY